MLNQFWTIASWHFLSIELKNTMKSLFFFNGTVPIFNYLFFPSCQTFASHCGRWIHANSHSIKFNIEKATSNKYHKQKFHITGWSYFYFRGEGDMMNWIHSTVMNSELKRRLKLTDHFKCSINYKNAIIFTE